MSAPFTPEQEARIRDIAREEAEAAITRGNETAMKLATKAIMAVSKAQTRLSMRSKGGFLP